MMHRLSRVVLVLLLVGHWTMGVANSMTLPNEDAQEDDIDASKPGELWAVLVAGSSGWFNYRHQADVCHAYQILHQNGVPDDHIIVMMYDDISNNTENPTPGVIINRPEGPNVYDGVLKDYTGEDVTPRNFLNILKGNTSAMAGIGSGKVVNSTRRDRIFINLVDHGGPGLFGFPDKVLHARSLVNTILHLHRSKKFKEMVIYLESCESGSMFKNLIPDNIKVYAVTASRAHESSYACYMDEERNTYLGDVFSVKWMEDTDNENIQKERLKDQFHLVRKEVTTSRVMEWGERDINRLKLWEFMGEKYHHDNDRKMNAMHYHTDTNTEDLKGTLTEIDIVKKSDYEASISKKKIQKGSIAPKKFMKNDDGHSSIPQKVQKSSITSKVNKKSDEGNSSTTEMVNIQDLDQEMDNDDDPCISSAVASPDVPLAILKYRTANSSDEEKQHWQRELGVLHMTRLLVHVVSRALVNEMTHGDEKKAQTILQDTSDITQWDCYDRSVDIFHEKCFNLGKNPYALRVMQILVGLCQHGYTAQGFLEAAQNICVHSQFTGII